MRAHHRSSFIPPCLRTASLLCVLAAAFPYAARSADFETPVAIVGVTAVTGPGSTVENATIVIEDGRIAAVGPSVNVPPDADVFDGAGLWAYPGFIDATSHVGMPEDGPDAESLARLTDDEKKVSEGPRTSMQLANRKEVWPHRGPDDVYVADDDALARYRSWGFTTALISPRPGIIGGHGDVVQLSGHPIRRATLKQETTQIMSFGTPPEPDAYRKGALYPVARIGAVALMRQTFIDAEWYRTRRALYADHPNGYRRPEYDPVLEATIDILDRKQRVLFLADTPDEIHHALDLAAEFNQRIAILGGREAWKVADRLFAENVPVIVRVDWPKKPALAPKPEKENGAGDETDSYTTKSWSPKWEDDFFEPLALRRERIRLREEHVDNVRKLIASGVDVALTERGLKKDDTIRERLNTMIEHGLAPDDALRVLTASAAAILGVDDQLGTIAAGKIANLVLLTKPLEDENAKVKHLYIDGERFDFDVLAKKKKNGDETNGNGEEGADDAEPEDAHPWAIETEADRARPIQTGGNLLLRNATVVTVTQGTLPQTDVLVLDGKIAKIGRNIPAPAGTSEIDLTGRWLTPGIIDPHSHMAIRGGVNEWTQSITCEVRIRDVIDPTHISLHRALAGGITTIHTMHGSANSMGGQNAVLKLKYQSAPHEALVTTGPRIVKFALGENVTRTRPIPRFPNTRMGVESVMRQAFNDAREYRNAWNRYRDEAARGTRPEPLRRDLRLEALNDIMDGNIWVHSHCYRADEILRLLAVAEDYGFRIATLQHVLEGYRVAPEMLRHGVAGSTFSDWWSYKTEARDAIPYNASMMMHRGIVTSLNSDSGETVRHMPLEAAKMMRFGGLTADEALRLITINPAIQIGLDSRVGSIEVGKDGDFAVFNGHPLDTFAHNEMTIIEGEVYFKHAEFDSAAHARNYVPEPPTPLLDIATNASGRYAIVGATVHPVSSAPIEDAVVVIEDGRIASIANTADGLAAGVTRVDAAGLHVYPGLINAASQIGVVEISSLEVTNDRADIAKFQPELRTISAVNAHGAHAAVSLCEGITTAAVMPSGGIVSGRAGLVQLTGWSMPEMLRNPELGLVVRLPSLPTEIEDKEERKKKLEEHKKAIEEIEAFFERAQHYAKVAALGDGDSTHDVRLDAMIPYVRGEKPVLLQAHTYKEILGALRFADAFALTPIILGGDEAWKCAATLAEKNVPVIMTAVFGYPTEFERWNAYYANAAALDAAGVKFCISSYESDGFNGTEKQLPVHAGMAVAHGLPEDAAIRSITLSPAEILGVADEIGSLEAGKIADVIITTGNPCRANTRTVGCFVAGNPVELTSIHEQNHEKFLNRPEPELPPAPRDLRGPPPMRTAVR